MECNGIRRSETYTHHQNIDIKHHYNCFMVRRSRFPLVFRFVSRGSPTVAFEAQVDSH